MDKGKEGCPGPTRGSGIAVWGALVSISVLHLRRARLILGLVGFKFETVIVLLNSIFVKHLHKLPPLKLQHL